MCFHVCVCVDVTIKSEADSDTSDDGIELTGDSKPYSCLMCKKRFKYRGSLDLHRASHNEQRKSSFVCLTCDRQFTSEGQLLRHQMSHVKDQNGLNLPEDDGCRVTRQSASQDRKFKCSKEEVNLYCFLFFSRVLKSPEFRVFIMQYLKVRKLDIGAEKVVNLLVSS